MCENDYKDLLSKYMNFNKKLQNLILFINKIIKILNTEKCWLF